MTLATTTTPAGGLSGLDYGIIGLYLVSMLGMGIWIAMKQRSTDDFFVGGRNLPAWAVGISLFASLLSTITYLGMPGEMFRTGVAFLTRQLPIPLVLIVIWFLWIPFFMRLNLTSAYEYLERRFNYTVRALAAIFCLMLLFGWISVVVLTASMAMSVITQLKINLFGDPADTGMYVIIASVGMFSVLYTTLGGIRAVVWTDVIQFFVLLIGALFTMGTIAYMTNSGVGDWLEASQQFKHEEVQWFDRHVTNRSTVFSISIAMFSWYVCTHGANQVALQRYFTVKDVSAARRTYIVSAVASIVIGVILAGVGIALMYFLQDHDLPVKAKLLNSSVGARGDLPDKVFPQFISLYLPAGLKGMVVAALFAAAMSTIDSGSNSASTIITVDFLRPFARQTISADEELRRARMLTASAGIVVVAYTIGLYHVSKGTNIIDLCQKGFNCFLGPLGALFVLGMFSRRATARAVVPAFILGEIVGIGTSYCQDLTAWGANSLGGTFAAEFGGATVLEHGKMVYLGTPFSTHLVIPCAWLATMITAFILSVAMRTRATAEQQTLMWAPIVRGKTTPQSVTAATEQ